jgi:hypothetical protein
MTKRQVKKLLKNSKCFLEITIKDEPIEDGNKVLINPEDKLAFTQFGVTVICVDIPYVHIPYWRIGFVTRVSL